MPDRFVGHGDDKEDITLLAEFLSLDKMKASFFVRGGDKNIHYLV